MIEIISKRTERNKVFDLGNKKRRLVCHCKPIHYKSKEKSSWDNIDLDFQDDKKGNFITDKNKVSIGFRKDRQLYKYFGARYDYEHQFESTIKEIKLDKVEQVKSNLVSSLQRKSKTGISHQLNSEIEIINKINEVSLTNFVKVNNPIGNFKIVEELHLKGLKCSNKKTSSKYVIDKFGRFNFVDEKGELKFWINQPFFEDDKGEHFQSIEHTLQEINGHLIYTKTPTKEGQDDLILAQYPILIDTNTYYSSTSDGYVEESGTVSWADTRGETTGNIVDSDDHFSTVSMQADHSSKVGQWRINRSFFYFDTSDLGAGATVTAAVLKLYGYVESSSDVCAMKGIQADPLTTADYNNFTGSEYVHANWGINAYQTLTFNAQGKSDVETQGTTKICCREYTHDYLDSAPVGTNYPNGCWYSDEELTTKDPKLEIDYTAGGGEAAQFMTTNKGYW